ncbi:MAG: RNA polymerase sigma-70 factor (ECF subfamily) [Planctomycetota bacterium]|jgi:RNA polymerase sigma-70 factor (ECF subfamily)
MSEDNSEPELTTAHVRRAVDGDAQSLSWLVERFSPLMYAAAANRLGPQLRGTYDPADVVQDAWVAALPKLSGLKLLGPRATPIVLKYLSTTVANRVRKLLERQHPRQARADGNDNDLELHEDPMSGILTKAVRAESKNRVHRALEAMREQYREVVILRGIEQQPLASVAAQLGIDPGTVAVRYHRALKLLKQHLPDSVFADLYDTDS